jgi:PKD repeat protein
MAAIGANFGSRAADSIFSSGDLPGSITRIFSTAVFNAMSPADLRVSYDVLLITWDSDPGLNLDWNTRILPYMQLGGDVIYEDPNNVGHLAPAVIGQEFDADGPYTVAAVPVLTDGVNNTFVNRHTRYLSWDPQLHPFITSGGDTIGLYGEFGSGRIVLTGPDQDFHAIRGAGDPYGNQYKLLVNEIRWVSQSSLAVKVIDVAPVVNPIVGPNPSPAVQGITLSFSGSFSNAGPLDTHVVQWDFGDGTILPFTPSDGPGALTPTHIYTASGTFTVTLTVKDDDGMVGSASKVVTVVPGSPQFFAGSPNAPARDATDLTQEQLQPIVAQAIAQLGNAGFNVRGLDQVKLYLASLPGSLLGLTYQHTIWIDQNAQGYGWYIDVSQGSNVAFTQVAGTNEFLALPDSPANGHVDLLTVVTHELGHVLGFPSIDSGILGHDWMTVTLGTGIRRYPDVVGGSGPNGAGVPAADRVDTKSLTAEPLVPTIGPLSVVTSTSLFVLSPPADMPAGSSDELSVPEVPMFIGLSFTPPMTASAILAAPSANLSRWRLPTDALDRLFADVDPSGLLTSENAFGHS